MLMVAVISIPLMTGCAGLKGGLQSARTVVNKGFDVADKLADGADKLTSTAIGTATATATTATSGQ